MAPKKLTQEELATKYGRKDRSDRRDDGYKGLMQLKRVASSGRMNPIEYKVAGALIDLETNNPELKADLRVCQFLRIRVIPIDETRKAIVIVIPQDQLPVYRRIQPRLVRELEKKFSDMHVLLVAKRPVLPKRKKTVGQEKMKRPIAKTLRSVHEKLLEDLVYPTEIVGKRVHYAQSGQKTIKVFLDKKDHTSLAYKLDTFAKVYRHLTTKNVEFDFDQLQHE
eukprot:TRINITY_DN58149_c0_g1_i1.p1 TRINITY_DN58149_c0_g1~~TRINITY_DN58149_c0_g1_i1.p1  ORF type:complete len:223 (+),score=15.18 TRINITY_DN58149_c0_g1_i1:141-809(+)